MLEKRPYQMTAGYRRVIKIVQLIPQECDEAVWLISVETTAAIYKTTYRQKVL